MDNLATFMTRPVSTIGITDDERVLITAWYVQYATAYAQRLQTHMYDFLAMQPHQHVGEFFEYDTKPCFVTTRAREIAVPEEYLEFFAFKSPEGLDAYPCMSADRVQITETVDETVSIVGAGVGDAAPLVFDNDIYFDDDGDFENPYAYDNLYP